MRPQSKQASKSRSKARLINQGIMNHVWIGYRIIKRRINKRGNIQRDASDAELHSNITDISGWLCTLVHDDYLFNNTN